MTVSPLATLHRRPVPTGRHPALACACHRPAPAPSSRCHYASDPALICIGILYECDRRPPIVMPRGRWRAGDGNIDSKELGLVLFGLGQAVDGEDLEEMVAAVDNDSSGVIEFDEFLVLMVRRGPATPPPRCAPRLQWNSRTVPTRRSSCPPTATAAKLQRTGVLRKGPAQGVTPPPI